MFVQNEEFKNGIHTSCTGRSLASSSFRGDNGEWLYFSCWDTGLFTVVEVNSDGSEYVFSRRDDFDKAEKTCVKLVLHDSYGNLSICIEVLGSAEFKFKYENQRLEFNPLNRTIDHVKAMIEIACQELSLKIKG